MIRTSVFISGGGSNMVTLVRDMLNEDHPCEACLVVSNVTTAGGLAKAEAMGVPTVCVDHREFGADRARFEAEIQKHLIAHNIDLICLAGFMRVLSPSFVEPWRGRMLNIHPSLLPKYRGLNTHARAIDAGDQEGGCTVHEVIPDLDAGPILGQATVPIGQGETPASLAQKVLEQEHLLYPRTLRSFAERFKADL